MGMDVNEPRRYNLSLNIQNIYRVIGFDCPDLCDLIPQYPDGSPEPGVSCAVDDPSVSYYRIEHPMTASQNDDIMIYNGLPQKDIYIYI
jgi:hypothetical protein